MIDMNKFCRTCMCQILCNTEICLKSYNLKEYEGLAEKLRQCTTITVQPYDDDRYPGQVCEICFVKICDFYEFQQMCRHSIDKFKEMMQEQKNETEEIELYQENISSVDTLTGLINSVDVMNDVEIERIDMDIQQLGVKKMVSDPFKQNTEIENIHNRTNKTLPENIINFQNVEDNEDFSEEYLSECSEMTDDEANEKPDTKKRLHCSLCSKKFILKRCLEAHLRTHQGLLDHPCPRKNCGRSYRRLCDLRQHIRVHDGLPREYRCVREGCDSIFDRYGDLIKHRVEEHGAPKSYKCDVSNCGQEFKTNSYLRRHKEKQHSKGPQKAPETHMCDTCGAVLRSAATLRMHSLIHVDKSQWPYVCDFKGCSKRFRIQQQLTIHKNRHDGIKNYPCPHCEMRFVTSTNLKNHINTHTWERTWSCEICPKVCNTPDLLRKHCENKHGIVKRYPCAICHRQFKTANAKMFHEMSHNGDDNQDAANTANDEQPNVFLCNYCEWVFESQSKKKYHEMVHTGEKPHVCEECGKGFRTTTLLKTHMRSHMKELPRDYVCSVCDRAFFSAQSLKHHEMKHTKERPYNCEECGFSFRWPNNLSRHRKLHLRDKKPKDNDSIRDDENVEILMEDDYL